MFGIGSRTYYAEWKNIIFNFEYIRDRNYFVDHAEGALSLTAKEAYDKGFKHRIQVYASYTLGANKERKERINNWYRERSLNANR